MKGSAICGESDNAKQATIKGLRWLLLRRRDNLEKDAARRLKRGLALNAPLQCGYLLKEELAELCEQRDGRTARKDFASADPIVGSDIEPCAKMLFAGPATHIETDLGKDSLH